MDESWNSRDFSHSGFISNWEDDTKGVQEETAPHESPEKEILWATENGKLEVVMKLLGQNRDLVKVTDTDGYTPLHRACYNNHASVVEFLLENGANIYAETKDKWTALHSACHWNSMDCVLLLITCGVDVNLQTNGGLTPLHLAAGSRSGKTTMQILLTHPKINAAIKNDAGETAYEIAARSGMYAYVFEMAEPCLNQIRIYNA